MQKSSFEVEVLVNGKPLKEYFHKGNVYVEGKKGSNFSLRLRNNSSQRKLFIPSVDGLSVMNGEEANPDSGGYIVGPHSSITVDGWRKDDSTVAEFYFSSVEQSYRKRMGRGNNIGVIGCLIFDEYIEPIRFPYPPSITLCQSGGAGSYSTTTSVSYSACSSADYSSGGVQLRSMKQDIGTGWGSDKRSEVVTVEFEKTGSPEELAIFYNTREQLEEMGISFKKQVLYATPQAFPGRYCKPPTSGCRKCDKRGAAYCTC